MKKVLLRAPLLTNSGYGIHSRQLFSWLYNKKDVELTVECVQWGRTPWILDTEQEDDDSTILEQESQEYSADSDSSNEEESAEYSVVPDASEWVAPSELIQMSDDSESSSEEMDDSDSSSEESIDSDDVAVGDDGWYRFQHSRAVRDPDE